MPKQRNTSEQTEEERLQIGKLFDTVIPAYIKQRKETQIFIANAKKLGLLGSVTPEARRWMKKERLL